MTERANETEAHVRAVAAAGDPAHANKIAAAALEKGLRHPAFHAARARWLQLNDRHAEALNELKAALALAPRDAGLFAATGISLLNLNRPAKAIAAFDAAILVAPAHAQMHYYKGCAHAAAGDLAAALSSHERAIALQPDHVDALAALAAAAARGGDAARARPFAERALRSAPGHSTAAIALVMCDLHDRDFHRAEKRLSALLSELTTKDQTRALALGLLGDALDGQNRTDAAFEAYAEKNRILEILYKTRFDGEARLLNRVERLIAELQERAVTLPAHAAPAPSPARRHVFLLGFMRSGTTLLQQVFAAHPDVETLEERETFAGLFNAGGADIPERLARLSGEDIDRAREMYWERVRGFGAKPEGTVFLDKQPFNTLNLPLIAMLFPTAKIIFLVRDPRDVVLSCFRRHLEVKPTTFELLTLSGAARFYDRVMQLAEIYRAKLSLDVLECRYEDVVADFENRVRAICGFLEMPWNKAMRDFDRTARARTIRSVSSNQVRRGLYAEGAGQWRRYEKQLAPVFPVLQPWVERFGY
ncbi:MAG TPA: sulfotransferase [Rhizomicrobium sp.]|jgi:tetratricopeptide (TPR) repeat protein